MQDSNPRSQTPIRQQTECSLTNRLSFGGSSLKLELDSPSLWSASIQPTRPHCRLAFAPGSGDIHVCFVNFDALAQASDIRIERRHIVFLCWMQGSNPRSQTPIRQQTECSLTNRLSYRGSSLKLELDNPSLWSASIQPTRPHCQLAFAPGSGDIHVCCC